MSTTVASEGEALIRNMSRHIEHYDYTIDYRLLRKTLAERVASLRQRQKVELTVACLIVHATARTLVDFRQFCCAVDGSDYIENLTIADPIRIHWQVHVDGAIRSHRALTSPQDLSLAELAGTLHRPDGGIGVSAPPDANPLGDPAFVIRHCEGSARDADHGPSTAVAALLLSKPAVESDQIGTTTASALPARLAYDRRIIAHTDVLGFVTALDHNLRSVSRSLPEW